jgi:oxygen-independent coproporphyrinogen-3 oxidase
MHNDGLAILGRKHSVEDSVNTVNLCSKLFKNVSVDMIYARPGHSVELWKDELMLVLGLNLQHLSLYQLVVDEDTVFGNMHKRGELLLPDEDACADMFELTQEITQNAGFPSYEISNHAKPGYECKHNIRYWKYNDYIGIGPGAHSRITINGAKYAIVEESNPQMWLKSLLLDDILLEEQVLLSQEEQAREALLVGLRMTEGIDCGTLPFPLNRCVDETALKNLVSEGYLEYSNNIIRGTNEGRKRLNALMLMLLK